MGWLLGVALVPSAGRRGLPSGALGRGCKMGSAGATSLSIEVSELEHYHVPYSRGPNESGCGDVVSDVATLG